MSFECKKAMEYLQEYMNTYPNQHGYEDYTEETFIDDILYGLGVAVNDKEHRFGNGFDKFKKKIVEHIKK